MSLRKSVKIEDKRREVAARATNEVKIRKGREEDEETEERRSSRARESYT